MVRKPTVSAPARAAVREAEVELTEPADAAGSTMLLRRSVIYGLGTLLLLFNAYFGTYSYVVVQALLWTQTSLLRGPVVVLFFLVLINLLLIRVARRWALSQGELVTLYAMLCIGTCAAGIGFVQHLVNQMAGVFYFATPGNGWQDLLWPHIPSWFAPRDPDVINGYFRGNSTFYAPHIIAGWSVPVLAWSAFIFVIFWVLLCAMSLVRGQWVEEERLTFPLVLLPLEMTRGGGNTPFWKNKLMWAGFFVAGALESMNALNFLFPSIPSVPLKPVGPNMLEQYMTNPPWNQMGILWLAFYPFAIGIGYLLALDVSFSCWFLYLCVKGANVLSFVLGYSAGGGSGPANRMPFIREQSVGAFIGIAFFSLWMMRHALARAWREMKRPTGADRDEVMSYRMAILGGIAGLLFLVGFLTVAGLPIGISVLFVLLFVCFSLTLARIVSEAGAGWAQAPTWTMTQIATDIVGANNLSPKSLTLLHGYTSWTADMRDNPMPQQAHGIKLGQSAALSPRVFLWPLVFAAAVGVIAAFWAHLDIYYTYGAATAKVRPWLSSFGSAPFRRTASIIATPTYVDLPGLLAAGFGALTVVGFWILRLFFAWWPLHPVGYALATTPSMDVMWFPFFLAWLAKLITLRYGGIAAYRAALPFFLGLILGDYVVPALWGLFGMVTDYQQYMAFPT